MTKRILSAILAVVLVVTSLAVPVFGATPAGAQLNKDESSNKLTLTWSPVEGAKIYQVSFFKDGVTVNSTTVTVSGSEDNTAAKCTVTYTPSVGGNYTAQVSAKEVANGAQLALYTSNSISIPLTGSGSGGLQITSSGNITNLSWNNDGYSVHYYVEYTTSEGKSGFYVDAAQGDKTTTTINTALNDIKSIVIYKANVAGDAYSGTLATWTNNGSSTGGNTGSSSGVQIQGSINVSVSGSKGVVTWGAVSGASAYTVTISNNSGSYPQRFGPSTTSATFDYYSNMAYNIIVSATVNGQSSVIGVAEIAAGSGGSSIGGTVVATRPSSNSSSVFLQWTGNSAPYLITYSASGYGSQMTQVATTNYITLNCDPNYSWVFTVSSLTNGSVVGYAALNRGSSSSSNNSGSIGTTGSLTISRGLNSSVVSWPQ